MEKPDQPTALEKAMQELIASFTPRQLMKIAKKASQVRLQGFGVVAIEFKEHRARFIRKTESEDIDS